MPVTNNTWWPSVTTLTAKQLLEQGYKQVSAKYRQLARLPEGKTGKQALADIVRKRKAHIEEEIDQWVEGLGEQGCASHYMRCFAMYDDLVVEVDSATLREFRRIGGEAA